MHKKETKIISVGGSIIIPKTGFDIKFLKKFRSLILKHVKQGQKFVLVIGGGGTCRQYQNAAKSVVKLSKDDLDWIGINTTVYNAKFVQMLFKDYAYKEVITDPRKQIKTNKSIIIAAGWKPGCSTDKGAVMLAKAYKAKEVINLSNIDFVYDKDPSKFKNAKKIKEINWKDFRKNIVGYKWVPGANAPFDPIASGQAEKMKLKVSILNGNELSEVDKVLNNKNFRGTVIS